MPTKKTEDVKKHGDTMEPLIDRTGASTQRKPSADDDPTWRRDEGDKATPGDDA